MCGESYIADGATNSSTAEACGVSLHPQTLSLANILCLTSQKIVFGNNKAESFNPCREPIACDLRY